MHSNNLWTGLCTCESATVPLEVQIRFYQNSQTENVLTDHNTDASGHVHTNAQFSIPLSITVVRNEDIRIPSDIAPAQNATLTKTRN